MGGSAELFESPESKQTSFPSLSLDQFDLRDVRATLRSQNRIHGPHANEQLQGSVDLNKLKDKNLPAYDFERDPKMSEF